jgi:hypothetical protein
MHHSHRRVPDARCFQGVAEAARRPRPLPHQEGRLQEKGAAEGCAERVAVPGAQLWRISDHIAAQKDKEEPSQKGRPQHEHWRAREEAPHHRQHHADAIAKKRSEVHGRNSREAAAREG